MALIDFSNARRFYSSMGNPLGLKGLTTRKAKNYVPVKTGTLLLKLLLLPTNQNDSNFIYPLKKLRLCSLLVKMFGNACAEISIWADTLLNFDEVMKGLFKQHCKFM